MCSHGLCCLDVCKTFACYEYHLYHRCGAQLGPEENWPCDADQQDARTPAASTETKAKDTASTSPS